MLLLAFEGREQRGSPCVRWLFREDGVLRKLSTRKRVVFFCFYSALIILVILLATGGAKTWRALQEMQGRYLALALAIFVAMTYFDILRLQVLTSGLGTHLSLAYSLKTILAYYFLSAITPAVTGGEPLMVYMLKEKGVGVGKGTSIVVIRGVLLIFFIAIGGPIIIYSHSELLHNTGLRVMFGGVAWLLLALIAFLTYTLYNPGRGERLIEKTLHFLERFPYFKKHAPHLVKKIDDWIDELSFSLKFFIREKKNRLFWATVWTIMFMICNYSLAYVLLKGLNFDLSIWKVFMVQIVLYFFLYFSPTPGGSGVAELGFYGLVAPLVPQHLLGILIILWRFFSVYLGVLMGGAVIMKTFGIDRLEGFAEEEIKPVLEMEE